jgi:hypothetical protein
VAVRQVVTLLLLVDYYTLLTDVLFIMYSAVMLC